mgnify:CR=1 FL=1
MSAYHRKSRNVIPPVTSLVRLPLRLVPPPLTALMLEQLLRRSLASLNDAGDLDFLDGRRLCVRVTDLELAWLISREHGRLRVLDPRLPAEATIAGKTRDLVLLASRREDPDTLFFQRRLVIEGDVEFGLQAKNLLDSLEWEALPPPLRWLLARAGELAAA